MINILIDMSHIHLSFKRIRISISYYEKRTKMTYSIRYSLIIKHTLKKTNFISHETLLLTYDVLR